MTEKTTLAPTTRIDRRTVLASAGAFALPSASTFVDIRARYATVGAAEPN